MEPVDLPAFDALLAAAFSSRLRGRQLWEALTDLSTLAFQPVSFLVTAQTEDFVLLTVYAPQQLNHPATPRSAWTAAVQCGRSILLHDEREEFVETASCHVAIELDAPCPDRPWSDSSPSGANVPRFDPDVDGAQGRRPSPRHLIDVLSAAHPELLHASITRVAVDPFDVDPRDWND